MAWQYRCFRDWGHAKDFVRMQWLMLQQEYPEDFVIATGVQYSIRQFLVWAAEELGICLKFDGEGLNEIAIVESVDSSISPNVNIGDVIVRIDSPYFRPTEVESLLGDFSKAKQQLGWQPEISAQELCREMVAHDLKDAKKGVLLKNSIF